MKKHPRFLIIVGTICGLTACTSPFHRIPNRRMSAPAGPLERIFEQESVANHNQSTECVKSATSGISEIALERTSCYGWCPMYTVTLRNDGTAEWHGYGNVEKLGTRRGQLDSEVFEQLGDLAIDIGFFESISANYSCPITDNPTAYVSIVRNGTRKTIRHYAPAATGPPRLRAFEERIDEIAARMEWK